MYIYPKTHRSITKMDESRNNVIDRLDYTIDRSNKISSVPRNILGKSRTFFYKRIDRCVFVQKRIDRCVCGKQN